MPNLISSAIRRRVNWLKEMVMSTPAKALWITVTRWRELLPGAQADGKHVDPATGELLTFEEYQHRWPAKAKTWEDVVETLEIFEDEQPEEV